MNQSHEPKKTKHEKPNLKMFYGICVLMSLCVGIVFVMLTVLVFHQPHVWGILCIQEK